MTGKENLNYDTFIEVEEFARSIFLPPFEVLNPARNFEGRKDLPRKDYMRKDIEMLLQATSVCFLPDWERSEGCRLERLIAEELELGIWYAQPHEYGGWGFTRTNPSDNRSAVPPVPVPDQLPSVLHRAYELVHKDRGEAYGHPITDFTRTGKIWSAILGAPVSAEQVALCMIGLKMSRECHRPNDDNRVDIAGYVETLDMVARKREGNEE